jgi:hypothetical protein
MADKQEKHTKHNPFIKPSHEGLLHKKLGKKEGAPLGDLGSKIAAAKKSGNVKLERELVFAQNARHFRHAKGHGNA